MTHTPQAPLTPCPPLRSRQPPLRWLWPGLAWLQVCVHQLEVMHERHALQQLPGKGLGLRGGGEGRRMGQRVRGAGVSRRGAAANTWGAASPAFPSKASPCGPVPPVTAWLAPLRRRGQTDDKAKTNDNLNKASAAHHGQREGLVAVLAQDVVQAGAQPLKHHAHVAPVVKPLQQLQGGTARGKDTPGPVRAWRGFQRRRHPGRCRSSRCARRPHQHPPPPPAPARSAGPGWGRLLRGC